MSYRQLLLWGLNENTRESPRHKENINESFALSPSVHSTQLILSHSTPAVFS